MYRYKNLLIGMNLTDQDIPVVQYAGKISHMANSKNAHFLHVALNQDIPDNIKNEFPEIVKKIPASAKGKQEETVRAHFNGNTETQTSLDIIEGKRLYAMLHAVRDKDIDLVIIGRKGEKYTRNLSERLVRKAPCSVLIVPEKSETKISKILVATDFSEHSVNAMDVAVAFASAAGNAEIICLHIYDVPIGYYETGKSWHEFAEIMKQNAEKEYARFIEGVETKGVPVRPVFKQAKKPVDAIKEVVEEEKVDLVSIGSRGRSASAAILLGSITERLIWECKVPIIAVKNKGDGMHFIEALLHLNI